MQTSSTSVSQTPDRGASSDRSGVQSPGIADAMPEANGAGLDVLLEGVEAARLGLKTAADSAASNAVLASTDSAITSQLAAPVTAELTAPVLTEAGTLAAGETTTVALQGAKTATDVAAATQAATAAAETAAATSAAAGSAGGVASTAAAVAPWVLGGVAVAYLLNELFD